MVKERRKSERRNLLVKATLPLCVVGGQVAYERRYIPSRRVNDIAVEEVECIEYITELVRQQKD